MKSRGKHKLGWKSFLLLCLALLLLPAGSAFAAVNKPFPQHTTYTSGTIKPNHVTQTSMDNSVKTKWNLMESGLSETGRHRQILR